jgi:conjugal transfer pilus assembly protein TraV
MKREGLLKLLPATGVAVLVAACTNMSGLSGSSTYACKAPDGVACDSVSGTYANALQNNLPSQQRRASPAPAFDRRESALSPGSPDQSTSTSRAPMLAPTAAPLRLIQPLAIPVSVDSSAGPAAPLHSSARILRLWFKPWEDADHDLVDQGFIYVQIDSGQWLVDHIERQVRDAYAPVRPPTRSATGPGTGDARANTATSPKSLQKPLARDIPSFAGNRPVAPNPDANE